MSKKQNILTDLKEGIVVDMFSDLKRYGTSLRSRISELRADGYDIESKVVDEKSQALSYFMPEFVKKG